MKCKISKANLKRLQSGKPLIPSEDEIQAIIVDVLRAHGLLVQITSRRVRKCHACGAWPRSGRGDGVSKGVADLLVRRPTWPSGCWLALEVKRPGSIKWSSLEQKAAAEGGDVVVVQSLEDALAALRRHEQMPLVPTADQTRTLEMLALPPQSASPDPHRKKT